MSRVYGALGGVVGDVMLLSSEPPARRPFSAGYPPCRAWEAKADGMGGGFGLGCGCELGTTADRVVPERERTMGAASAACAFANGCALWLDKVVLDPPASWYVRWSATFDVEGEM